MLCHNYTSFMVVSVLKKLSSISTLLQLSILWIVSNITVQVNVPWSVAMEFNNVKKSLFRLNFFLETEFLEMWS